MGRKVHPIGFRLGINQPWQGRWYAEGPEYTQQLQQDFSIRKLIHGEADKAGVSNIEVERFPGKVKVVVHTAKPGILIGRRLSGAEMAHSVWMRDGRVPLQTLRADIDFARAEALTTYGRIGVKVWVYKGEVLPQVEEKAEATEGVYVSE